MCCLETVVGQLLGPCMEEWCPSAPIVNDSFKSFWLGVGVEGVVVAAVVVDVVGASSGVQECESLSEPWYPRNRGELKAEALCLTAKGRLKKSRVA